MGFLIVCEAVDEPAGLWGIRAAWAAAFAVASVVAAAAMWGFTVDDALISIRYAHHLASGAGYRFNPTGPSTDGVTPLPWPFVIAPLAGGHALGALARVKVLGITLHALASALVGARAASSTWAGRITALAALATCLPFAAYGASGMDTPLATLLCASCVFYMKDARAAVFAGLAAAIRPELVPWAVAASCGLALARRARPRDVFVAFALAVAPFVACAVARRIVFGHFAPLALSAKPSDATHGALYAAAAVLASATPLLLLAPLALRRAPPESKVFAGAFVVHVSAVILAGGDSMPYARLFVPLVPSVLFVHLQIATIARGPLFWLRSAFALGLAMYMAIVAAPRGRTVMRDRADLLARAAPVLRNAKVVAAVDIGWVSAATEDRDATIVDLAGLTDPEIAALPGGHTSKRVDGSMLLDRDVDTIVLYALELPDLWGHVVAARLARDRLVMSHYTESTTLALGASGAGYVVLERNP